MIIAIICVSAFAVIGWAIAILRHGFAPTKSEMWKQILELTEKCNRQSWHAGYNVAKYEEAEGKIRIDDLIEEVD